MNLFVTTLEAISVVAIAGIGIYLATARRYQSADSVANSYDQWTEDGILEFYWGEHIHLGHYGSPSRSKDFLTAKSDFVHEMVRWGGLDKLPAGTTVLDVGSGSGSVCLHVPFDHCADEILDVDGTRCQWMSWLLDATIGVEGDCTACAVVHQEGAWHDEARCAAPVARCPTLWADCPALAVRCPAPEASYPEPAAGCPASAVRCPTIVAVCPTPVVRCPAPVACRPMLAACSPAHPVEKLPTHASTVAHRVMSAEHRVLLPCSDACAEDQQDDAWPQLHQVVAAVDSLAKGKATGPDGIRAELLKAGGSPLVRRLHQVIRCAVRNISIPHAWKGGRLATAWKMKGLPDICDNHRGLLLGDHSGKVMTSLLKDQLDEPYLKALPNAQSGCVRNRSTPFVCHTVRLFLDFCRTTHRSVFVLFLDLTKAFDFIVREFVMGRKKGD